MRELHCENSPLLDDNIEILRSIQGMNNIQSGYKTQRGAWERERQGIGEMTGKFLAPNAYIVGYNNALSLCTSISMCKPERQRPEKNVGLVQNFPLHFHFNSPHRNGIETVSKWLLHTKLKRKCMHFKYRKELNNFFMTYMNKHEWMMACKLRKRAMFHRWWIFSSLWY